MSRGRSIATSLRSRLRPQTLRVPIPEGLAEVLRQGATPLEPGANPEQERLRLAFVVPSFRRVSGGHTTIATLVRGLKARGHHCSVWLVDDAGRGAVADPHLARRFEAFFGRTEAPVHASFREWAGADVVIATAWQTAPVALRLPDARARAYLVQDDESQFYPTSAERHWAEWTYRQGMHCIAASRWLIQLLRDRYGVAGTHFDLGVDHETYGPLPVARRDDLVLYYARGSTPRRGVPLGMLALEELHTRRPGVEIALFGDERRLSGWFPHSHLGVLNPRALATTYASATVGLVMSLTNPSLIPQEMLACGLACVDVASESAVGTYGSSSPVVLAPLDPVGICEAIEQLLDDPTTRAETGRAGREWVVPLTWDRACEQVEDGLRAALAAASMVSATA